jgi:regulator of RNase E activity RraA
MAISKLSEFSSCEISDALVKLGFPNGGLIPDISVMSPPDDIKQTLCAPAYTVRMVPASDTSAPKLSEHFVDTAPAGSFIVIDAPTRLVVSPLRRRYFLLTVPRKYQT